MNADNILMPYTKEALDKMAEIKLAEVENELPGLAEKAREWMQTEEFIELYKSEHPSCVAMHRNAARCHWAPISMKEKIAKLAGLPQWDFNYYKQEDKFDLVRWLSNHLWKAAKL